MKMSFFELAKVCSAGLEGSHPQYEVALSSLSSDVRGKFSFSFSTSSTGYLLDADHM